jgi:acetolactate synthase I/II/III large subunit
MTRPSEIRTGAAAVVHAVACVGTTAIFGVPRSSGAIERAIDEAVNVRFVAAVHEQGAGHMAQGYARATGRPGVVVVQAGYPAMHLVTPLGDAWMDSTPLVCLVEHRGDELDEYRPRLAELAGPITKRSWIATDAGELRDAMIAALDEATTGRWRPVVVETTTAALEAHVEGSARADEPGGRVAELDRAAVKSAAALIRSSAAPILYVGGGVLNARATEELLHLAETARLPVVSTLMGKGAFPEDHPLHYGWPGMHGPKWSNLALNRADLIIAAGARFDDRVTGRLDAFAPGARVIHLDADRREIGKIRHADVAVVGDLRATLVLLTEELAATRAGDAPSSPWLEQMDSWRERFPLRYDEESGLLKPQAVVRLLQKRLPDAVFTTGVGQHQMWAMQYLRPVAPRTFIS